jgi:putative hydrolase of the HAD superfamily
METKPPPGSRAVAAVLFEPYGTLLDIETDERDWYAFLNLSRFLEYRGVRFSADELRWLWFEKIAQQLAGVPGPFPEIDVRVAWRELINQHARPCSDDKVADPATFLTDVTMLHRALTRRTLRPMEGVRTMLERLSGRVRLGIVTDSQPDYILPELRIAGIDRHFEATAISAEHGYRKPDPRLFEHALQALNVPADHALFVGVDTGRDIAGARAAGLRSVLVLTPYGSKDIALGEPDYVVDRIAEIGLLLEA